MGMPSIGENLPSDASNTKADYLIILLGAKILPSNILKDGAQLEDSSITTFKAHNGIILISALHNPKNSHRKSPFIKIIIYLPLTYIV